MGTISQLDYQGLAQSAATGKAGGINRQKVKSAAPPTSKFVSIVERDQHRQFQQWCNLNAVISVHFRMDKKAPLPGQFDFVLLANGRGCQVEFKVFPNKLSDDQQEYQTRLAMAAVPSKVAYTVAEAIAFVKQEML